MDHQIQGPSNLASSRPLYVFRKIRKRPSNSWISGPHALPLHRYLGRVSSPHHPGHLLLVAAPAKLKPPRNVKEARLAPAMAEPGLMMWKMVFW